MQWMAFIPGVFFLLLVVAEYAFPKNIVLPCYHRWDWILNLSGFIMQGLAIPVCGYLIAICFLPQVWPSAKGILPVSNLQSFLINFVLIDFLYYWQHRFFHQNSYAWKWHRCHHASPRVDVWTTSRNSLLTQFLFVYLLINPVVGFFCLHSEGFFIGAMLTASLDLLRHSKINFKFSGVLNKLLSLIFVSPRAHHRHHYAIQPAANFGANLIIWDKIFGTACYQEIENPNYQVSDAAAPLDQLLYPWRD